MSTTRTTTITTKKRRLWLLIILVLCIILASLLVLFSNRQDTIKDKTDKDYHTLQYNNKNYRYNTDIVTLLFLGIDTVDNETRQGQSDAIDLVVLDRQEEKIKLISIPRDTITDVKAYDPTGKVIGWQKDHLSLAYAYAMDSNQGCMSSADSISKLLNNIPINYYSAMNLSDLKEFQSIVGDIQVQVPNDSLKDVNPTWTKGNIVTINEENVEQFVRTRDTGIDYSAYDRLERQESYLEAYIEKLKNVLDTDYDNSINHLVKLLSHLYSNLSINEINDYAKMLMEYQFDTHQDVYRIPGQNKRGAVYDEFEVNEEELKQLVVNTFYR